MSRTELTWIVLVVPVWPAMLPFGDARDTARAAVAAEAAR
ncbi:hypothetical protein GCM10010399_01000 [Dactylosporangium fulvum]